MTPDQSTLGAKSLTDEQLLALVDAAEAVAPGAWEHDTEENEGAYGAGPGARHGFKSYVMFDGRGRRIFDGGNSEIALVQEECDEDGAHAWDESGRRVFGFSATFDPPQVRALILRAQAAEARVQALLADHARLQNEVSNSSRIGGSGHSGDAGSLPALPLGSLIRREREALGFSFAGLGKVAGMTKAHIWSLETGRATNPTILTLAGIAKALKVPLHDLAYAAAHAIDGGEAVHAQAEGGEA